jgi:hypothetical protein
VQLTRAKDMSVALFDHGLLVMPRDMDLLVAFSCPSLRIPPLVAQEQGAGTTNEVGEYIIELFLSAVCGSTYSQTSRTLTAPRTMISMLIDTMNPIHHPHSRRLQPLLGDLYECNLCRGPKRTLRQVIVHAALQHFDPMIHVTVSVPQQRTKKVPISPAATETKTR